MKIENIDLYRALVERNFPDIVIHTVVHNTRGWDSFVLEVNDEWIFRFPMRDDVLVYLRRELGLLPFLAPALSTPIPYFVYFGLGGEDHPLLFVGYPKLQGVLFEDESITEEQLILLAAELGTFISELHRFPIAQAVWLSVENHTPEQWRARYHKRYEMLVKQSFPRLDVVLRARAEHIWMEFLSDESIFTFQPVLLHADLVGGHILCDPARGRLTGIIDWGDCVIGDPALDFSGLDLQYGRVFVERVISHYQGNIDKSFWQRMTFYQCYEHAFSKLIYGSFGDEEIFEQGIAALRQL
jgi:aminoglycoside 2''-phosphotransferase